jgi:hypothetical protein
MFVIVMVNLLWTRSILLMVNLLWTSYHMFVMLYIVCSVNWYWCFVIWYCCYIQLQQRFFQKYLSNMRYHTSATSIVTTGSVWCLRATSIWIINSMLWRHATSSYYKWWGSGGGWGTLPVDQNRMPPIGFSLVVHFPPLELSIQGSFFIDE